MTTANARSMRSSSEAAEATTGRTSYTGPGGHTLSTTCGGKVKKSLCTPVKMTTSTTIALLLLDSALVQQQWCAALGKKIQLSSGHQAGVHFLATLRSSGSTGKEDQGQELRPTSSIETVDEEHQDETGAWSYPNTDAAAKQGASTTRQLLDLNQEEDLLDQDKVEDSWMVAYHPAGIFADQLYDHCDLNDMTSTCRSASDTRRTEDHDDGEASNTTASTFALHKFYTDQKENSGNIKSFPFLSSAAQSTAESLLEAREPSYGMLRCYNLKCYNRI